MKNIRYHIAKFLHYHRSIAIYVFLVMCFWGIIPAAVWPEKTKVYFYSCETNVNNFKSLKMEFDRYLSGYGPFEFQPFMGREAFETHIKNKTRCLIILSSWHFRSINNEYSLLPVLAGLQNGKKFQKRILVTIDHYTDLRTINIEPIASASSPQHTRSVLEQMLRNEIPVWKLNILAVPKDIDALMSVGFGMSKSALTSQNGFEQLKRINPKLFKKMKILKESDASLSLILAVPKGFETESVKMVDIFKNMTKDPMGREKIKMLGLDGWQELNRSDHLKLEAK